MLSVFFVASKLLNYILSPFVWILLAFLMGLLFRKFDPMHRFVKAGIIMLLVFSNPFLSNLAMKIWEPGAVKMQNIKTDDAVVVVLGGMVRYYNSDAEMPAFGPGVDRLMQALSLYHSGKATKMIICGGSGSLVFKDKTESHLLHKIILDSGVKEVDLFLDTLSRNTHENAVEAARIIKLHTPNNPVILVTSAFHMSRSEACFSQQGITTINFPVDAYSGEFMWYPDHWLFPSMSSLQKWDILFHEWFGLISYKMMGFI